MLRAGAALSRSPDPARAATAAAADALARAGASRADAAFVFAGRHAPAGAARAAAAASRVLGSARVVGAAAHGVLAGDDEEETAPAVAVLALAGVEAVAFRLESLAGAEDAAAAEIEDALGRSATEGDLVVLLADALAIDVSRLLRALDEGLPEAVRIGAGAALDAAGAGGLWCAGEPVSGGACGLVLRLARPARWVVAHGCRPITPPLRVSRSDGHWLLGLDGRPALDVYREAAGSALAADLRRASEHLLVALPADGAEGDFVARAVAGFAPERGAFALADALRPGDTLRLALRHAGFAREDFARALAAAGPAPAAGLYLSCPARGQRLFGHAGLETAYVARALAPAPLAGMFGSFQLAPTRRGAPTALHTHAGVLALLE